MDFKKGWVAYSGDTLLSQLREYSTSVGCIVMALILKVHILYLPYPLYMVLDLVLSNL